MIDRFNNRNFFLSFVGIWTLAALGFASVQYVLMLSENEQVSAWTVFGSTLLRFYVWAAFSPLIYQIVRRVNFERTGGRIWGWLLHVPLGLAFSVAHGVVYAAVMWTIQPSYRERYSTLYRYFRENVLLGSIYTGILLYSPIVLAIAAYLLYRNYVDEQNRTAQLQSQLSEAKLQALKMQLNPHFLFNTLHSISSLVLIDPPKANQMIARLGEFLRMTLENSEDQMVTLKKELDFLRSYLEIEQTRFQDRLSETFEVEPSALSATVPHLILQPIVENAIQHGIAPHASHGEIVVKAERPDGFLLLEVSDNGSGISTNGGSTTNGNGGTGLKNVRSRLAQIYGEDSRFEIKNRTGGGLTVELRFPYSTEENGHQLNGGSEPR